MAGVCGGCGEVLECKECGDGQNSNNSALSAGLSDITPLDISALAQRIISNTTDLAKLSFNKKLAIQSRASYYAIEQIEAFLKEIGR